MSGFFKLEGAFNEVALTGGHCTFTFAFAIEFLEVLLVEFRLGIKGVDMRRAAFHHEENAAFCFGGMMDGFGSGCLQEGRKGDGAESGT